MTRSDRFRVNLFNTLRVYLLLLVLLWTLVLAVLMYVNIYEHDQTLLESARVLARATFQRDLEYQHWSSDMGGLYAPAAALAGGGFPTLTTLDGKELVLVNPPAMARLVFARPDAGAYVHGHMTSLNPIRPENAPDPWEAAALVAFEQGVPEVSSVEILNGQESLRLIRPLLMEVSCLSCHEERGLQPGQVRGAISESVNMEPLRTAGQPYFASLAAGYLALWMLGLAGIALGALRLDTSLRRQQQLEHRLVEMSQHDALTGLFNRHHFEETLALVERLKLNPLTLLVADVDGLKQVNDEFGHDAGDQVLLAAASVLGRSFRSEDTLARTGGDEFVVILPATSAARAQEILERVRRSQAEYNAGGPPFPLSLSIGVATSESGTDLAEILKQADQAMYAEKAARKAGL